MSEESRHHGQSLIGERLIDEWLLALQGLYGAAGRKSVFRVELRIDDFWKQFGHCRQAQVGPGGFSIRRLAQNKLAAIGIVADVEPLSKRFISYV